MASQKKAYTTIRLILGDQLDLNHSWFSETNPGHLYVLAELPSEVGYVRHHILKVSAIFAAMRDFAAGLTEAGHQVRYLTLDHTANTPNFSALLEKLVDQYKPDRIDYQRPDEYRLVTELESVRLPGVEITCHDSEHFLVPFAEIPDLFETGRPARMETFYQKMRKRHAILVQGDLPVGGQWNFDAANRNKIKADDIKSIPAPLCFDTDLSDILSMLDRHQVATIGQSASVSIYPTSRTQSLTLLEYFCDNLLPRFGQFQDAMSQASEHGWSLYHSRLSFSLNMKMLTPIEVINRALDAYERRNDINLAQVEGFVRQILGWREFIRGVYWANMPSYGELNYLSATRKLPDYFWTGETGLNCVSQTVKQSLQFAYAHHIQRLMVTGVFGLIAGIDPKALDQWYLGIYADAFEWVELPNTRGMSQYADGGIIASKPYAASGNYINKMSDYCSNCQYDVKDRSGNQACPFNALYWDFIERHRDKLQKSARLGFAYRNWDNFDTVTQVSIKARAAHLLANLNDL